MKTLNKLILFSLFLFMLAGVASEAVQAQALKIGFIDETRIRKEYKDFVKAEEEFLLEQKTWEEEAVSMQTELQELLAEYDKQKLILSEDKKREKEALIRTKQEGLDAFTRQIFGPGGTAERKERALIGPIVDKVNKVIETVAIEGNFDVIYTTAALVYIKPIYDATDKVLEALDREE